MSKFELSYLKGRKRSPISYWVHHGVGEDKIPYAECVEFSPPFPNKDPMRGYPYLVVKVVGFEFEFASSLELTHCIDVLGKRNMHTTNYLSEIRGTSYGPNNHWLSRLPSDLKSWKKREKIVAFLLKARSDIEKAKIVF
ncbi:hypothetical protein FLL45_17055 [Aliikangiella marina]|uniref:Uncharacterized protein n=1 Tax=Aliikangiella marina TaxID=1712262 RepID=A0A545T7I3_9GAMM|nr:hypothetical protein [Aliikangiella marina]TQV73158.1 hypothetical protein FLL45_17055 [Aliikangiella marina]